MPTIRSAIWPAGVSASTATPGSPWWPMPTSMVPGSIWKFGFPTAGMVQGVSPMPTLRVGVDGVLRGSDHLVERSPRRSLGPPDLPHQDLARHAAPLLPLGGRRRRHVIVGHDGPDLDAVRGRHAHRHLDVHVVAGVVAVEAGHPLAALGGPEGVVEGLADGEEKTSPMATASIMPLPT